MKTTSDRTVSIATTVAVVAIALTLIVPSVVAGMPGTGSEEEDPCTRIKPFEPSVYIDPDCEGPLPPISEP